jgi:hypothetical protein
MLAPIALLLLTFATSQPVRAASLAATAMPDALRAAVHDTLARDARAKQDDWTEQNVVASDGAIDDRFGTSVAVSGDLAAVGAFDAKVGDNYQQGAVYVFAKGDGAWTETQKLVASDGAGMANFGAAVSIADGDILVSAIGANVGGNSNQGAVYVFANEGGAWTETQKLAASDGGSGDAFGNAIAASGGVALVGAKGATVSGQTLQGKVYVFASSAGTWSEQQILVADDGASNDLFGASLAIDGEVAIVGAPTLTYNFLHAGFAYVFRNDGGTWTQAQKLLPAETAIGDQFGYAVGLAGDTALITMIVYEHPGVALINTGTFAKKCVRCCRPTVVSQRAKERTHAGRRDASRERNPRHADDVLGTVDRHCFLRRRATPIEIVFDD